MTTPTKTPARGSIGNHVSNNAGISVACSITGDNHAVDNCAMQNHADRNCASDDCASAKADRAPARRMLSVEILRLAAICSIAIFHTFSPFFDQSVMLGPLQGAEAVSQSGLIAAIASSRIAMWALSMMMFLGSWGNHVFFMISGFFLIPRMAQYSYEPAYWRSEGKSTLRRCMYAAATVAFYLLVALAVNRWIVPIPGVGSVSSLTVGLEFIWLYVAFVVVSPLVAWILARLRPRITVALAALALIAVYALNMSIASGVGVSGVSFELSDWRKLMSAVTYAVSFALAGALGMTLRRAQDDSLPKTHWRAALRSRAFWLRVVVAIELAMVVCCVIAVSGLTYAMARMLSFKSTSVLSFALAVAMVMAAVCGDAASKNSDDAASSRTKRCARRLVVALTSGILGFYIVQSLMYPLWSAARQFLMTPLLRYAASAQGAAYVGWMLGWFAAGIAFSCCFVLVVCVADRVVRRPVLRAVHMSK